MCAGNAYFKHNYINKYTRVSREKDGMKSKSRINFGLVKEIYETVFMMCNNERLWMQFSYCSVVLSKG